MSDKLQQLALRIKELRDIFGYSPEETAAKLGLPAERYLSYENSGDDVPISVLYNIAALYGIDMTELISGNSPKLNTISCVRRGEGLKVDRFEGYNYENIGFKFMHRKMEPMIVTLLLSSDRPVPVTHSGQEINYCLDGEMAVEYDGKEIILKSGDCVYFDPSHPHGQRAVSESARFLTVIHE